MRDRVVRAKSTSAVLSLAVALLAGACSTSGNFEQVQSTEYDDGIAIPTTTMLHGTLPPTSTTSTVAPAAAVGLGVPSADAALLSMVGQLAAEPGLIAAIGQLDEASPASLAALFGLDEQIVQELELTLAQLQGVAALVAGADPVALAGAAGSAAAGSVDTSALEGLLAIASSLDVAAIAAVDGLSQQLIGGLVAAVSEALEVVDPTLVSLFAALLAHLDPGGLGSLGTKPSTAAVLAVFTSAALRTNPAVSAGIRIQVAGDPELAALVDGLEGVGQTLDPGEAATLAAVGSQLTPDSLVAMSDLVAVLDAPTTQDLFGRLAS